MTSSISATPRISINASVASTESNHSSNGVISRESITSPSASGSLSPLGLGGLASSRESISRDFKETINPKKRLPLSQSAFRAKDYSMFYSAQYTRFQEIVQKIKSATAFEKDEKKRAPARLLNSPLLLRRTAFTEMSHDKYFQKFPFRSKAVADNGGVTVLKKTALFNTHVGASAISRYNRPVTAFEIGDALAVFCLGQKEVFVHHFSSATDKIKDIFDRFAQFSREPKSRYRIYLVGGDGSPESVQLLDNIKSALLIYFGKNANIEESFINPNKDSPFPYISVACTTKKKFFFCRHD